MAVSVYRSERRLHVPVAGYLGVADQVSEGVPVSRI